MTFYDPLEHMDVAERADFEVRQHLYAQRRLAEIDQIDTKAKVRKMLAEVEPKRQVCAMSVSPGAEAGEKAKRTVCGKPGVRMLALTGHWTCADHDPLRHQGPTPCCVRQEVDDEGRPIIPVCDETDGVWGCTAGHAAHGRAHRFSRLEGA